MSGDVQPRKRKDKRRKRDDDESSHGVHITKMGNDDVHLHVHHDHGTGGHWCAKIIFFSLMAALLGVVALIIMENRGLEDLDTPLSESRFSNYFDGWVDEHRVEHEGHDVQEPSGEALDDHDDHDELEDHEEEEEDDHEEEEEPLSAELDEGEATPEEDEEEADQEDEEPEEEEDEEEGEEENNAGENITAEDDVEDEEADEEDEEEEEVEPTVEATTEATAEYEEDEDNVDEGDADDEDEVPPSEETPPSEAPEEEDDDQPEEEEEVEQSQEPTAAADDAENNEDKDDDDDDFESLDQDVEDEPVKLSSQKPDQDDQDDQDNNGEKDPQEEGSSWLASLAVKFGVGVALALVSRLVLIRKSPNTTEDPPAPEAVMRRRLTIATAEDHIPDDVEELPLLDDEYSEEEIVIEEEIEVEISDIEENEEAANESDDNVASMASYMPETFEQLSAMYKGKQEPPKDEPVKPVAEPQQAGSSDIYVEYEDGEIENYEHDDSDDDDAEITDEEDEISDVDDSDLMNRLDAKYGRLPSKEYESDPDSDDPSWTQIKPKDAPAENNELFEQELRKANQEMVRENYAQALRSFNMLTLRYTDEPLAHLGRAKVLAHLAERQQSNQRLWEAIDAYKRYLAFEELITSDAEFIAAGESCIKHLRFLGNHHQAVNIHELLIERSPGNPHLRNQLSLTHLMANNLRQVEQVSFNTLKLAPDDAVAQLHYGLVLKQLYGDYLQALPFLKYAVESEEEGTQEPFFYLALGETLQRLSRQPEAMQVFSKGVAKGFYTSQYQRSLYNVPGLKAQPFWEPHETGYQRHLEKLQFHWRTIRDEALELLGKTGFFEDEAEQLRHKGVWQQFELFSQGRRMGDNCQKTPKTCALVQQFPESSGCRRGQVKFSVMKANTHVWPHCGPTNCRLRAHLTLVAPEPKKTLLRVAEQERTWREGELFIFDDSFEHEVWHNGSLPRLVLILDMWHPELSSHQRRNLPAI
ncbi:uncharacterized protein Dana_GF11291, isoform D [Drosophila ananassae]|uniref:Uncharacterized protein, isoform D n=1 Tax=Drosophila ananassae TaxID=7217 RepID=A0A0P9C0B1_DROAN|nr:aspartyl/asparaginyl beta-hydroxylase isoform X2 [Drosophila ananassae]KPU76971.1 uncharacterized protein Dana_GF11291, isoform D [Drosophila ananassae]